MNNKTFIKFGITQFSICLMLTLIVASFGCSQVKFKSSSGTLRRGGLWLYLASASQSSDRVQFSFESISVVSQTGLAYPLTLSFDKVDSTTLTRQRRLAFGDIPPGDYKGLSVKIARASISGAGGDISLLVPEEALFVSAPMTIKQDAPCFLEMAYRQRGSLPETFRFVPDLMVHPSEMPIASQIGFVSSGMSGLVTVFDRRAMEVRNILRFGQAATDIIVDEIGNRLFIADASTNEIHVIDAASGDQTGSILLPLGAKPSALALAPLRDLLLSVNSGNNTISFIDPATFNEEESLLVSLNPTEAKIDRQGQRAFIFAQDNVQVQVIDLNLRQYIGTLETARGPIQGAYNNANNKLYVIHKNSPLLMTFDGDSLELLERRNIGIGARVIHVDAFMGLIYIGRVGSTLDIYDEFSLLPVDSRVMSGQPGDMIIDDINNNLLLTIPKKNRVVAVNLSSKNVVAEMDVVGGATGIALLTNSR